MLDDCQDPGETVRDTVRKHLGITLSGKLFPRFEEAGWYYDTRVPARCVCGESDLHCLRRPYTSAGKQYKYVACVCTACCGVFTLDDLKIKNYAALISGKVTEPRRPAVGLPARGADNREGAAQVRVLPATEASVYSEVANGDDAQSLNEGVGFEFAAIELEDAIGGAIASLSDPRDQRILTSMLGLAGHMRVSMAEIGTELKISRERVRQLQGGAVRRLNRVSRSGNDEAWCTPLWASMSLSNPINYLETFNRLKQWVDDLSPHAAYRQVLLVARIAGLSDKDATAIAELVKQEGRKTQELARLERKATWRGDVVKRRVEGWIRSVDWPDCPGTLNLDPPTDIRMRGIGI